MIPEILKHSVQQSQVQSKNEIRSEIVIFTSIALAIVSWLVLRKCSLSAWVSFLLVSAIWTCLGLVLDKKFPHSTSTIYYRLTALLSCFFVLLHLISNN